MTKRFGLMLALCLTLAGLPGAGSARAQSPTPASHVSQQHAPARPTTPAQSPVTPPATALTRGPGDFDLATPDAGLAALPAYRAVLRMEFAKTQAGASTGWTETLTMTVTHQPDARDWIRERHDISGTVVTRMAEFGGQEYDLEGDGSKCAAAPMDAANPVLPHLEPALLLPHVAGAELVAADELVAGTSARHYRFDERAVPFGTGAKAAGEVWVGADGRVLKYSLRADGDETYFGAGVTGHRTWQYELTDLQPPVAVQPPSGCGGSELEALVPHDAADVRSAPGSVYYTTTRTVTDTVAFYSHQLPPLGWKLRAQRLDPDAAQLVFSGGDRQVIVLVTGGAKTTVDVALVLGAPAATSTAAQAPTETPAVAVAPTDTAAPTAVPDTPTPSPTAKPKATVAHASTAGVCKTPGMQIASPASEAVISGRVHVRGTVATANMQYFKVEYEAPGGQWSFLTKAQQPVQNGELFMWDTTTLSNGRYAVRLTAIDRSGNYPPPCELWWIIKN